MTKADKEGQRKTPILRFKGFTDDWEQRKLGTITDTYSGGTPQVSVKDYYSNNEIPFIRSSDIHKNKTELYISSKGLENSSAKLVSKGHILYALYGATSGEVDVSKIDGAINQAVLCINAHNDLNYFLMLFLSKNKDKIVRKYIQGGQGNLSASIIKKIKVFTTSKLEETKISNLVKILSDIIALYERKLKLLSQVKKYFLDNLFAEKEYPNLRFKGYEDTWLKSKFSKFLSIPEKVKVTIDSPSRILTVKLNLGGVQKGANRTTLKLNSTTYYLRKAGQLIYGKQNLFNGSLAIIPSQFEGYVTSGDVPSLNIDNIDKRFLYYYIARKSFYKKTEAYSSGTGSKRIHEKTFLGFNIVYPEDLKEQEKISKLISSINSNIELYRSKKNNLMAIKKNLLNTMFI